MIFWNLDQSVSIGESGNGNERLREGTLRQLLDSARQPNGKILNALSFPLLGAGYEANPFSTDQAAWMQTLSAPFSKDVVAVPIGDFRWGITATAGAFHPYHIDTYGQGTIVSTFDGRKLWISAKDPNNIFHSIGLFFHDEFDLDKSASGLWGIEAILLEPGTSL